MTRNRLLVIVVIVCTLVVLVSIAKYSLSVSSMGHTSTINNTFLREVNKSFPGDNKYLQAKVLVNGFVVMADIAITDEQKTEGLDIKNNMTENHGMLFVFQQPDRYGFWMMGMKFPIDIIWLDSNGTVTHIEHSLIPCAQANSNHACPTYFPDKDSLFVLDTRAGFSMKHNVQV